eukprot:TRINITY_DN3854_c0_g3_i4.p1 TRINITY_DN3854_c0_g3~~TRINITY_DN3854_c0_g3_i4.p1  ORF type:complete len:404 (-),score=66.68 TRINITY_DN3854_c0_g3_i4:386-1597(-)
MLSHTYLEHKNTIQPAGCHGTNIRVALKGSIVCAPKTTRGAYTHVCRAAAVQEGPIIMDSEILQDQRLQRLEVLTSMDDFVTKNILSMLKTVEESWQPSDILPDPAAEDFIDQLKELRERSAQLPDDYLVVLAGDMITEEALPTYMAQLNTLDGVRDPTASSDAPWALWNRRWTAEENRHGDLMNKYMYLTGRVDLHSIERTIQNLIGTGMDPKTETNPYNGFVYTSFQERATKISHGNTARLAKALGDDVLGKVCAKIAGDEARHEQAYSLTIAEILNRDPDGGIIAFAEMMKKQVVMPAHLMDDCEHKNRTGRTLFSDFSKVAERLEVYTAFDYADIMQFLVRRWKIAEIKNLSGEAQQAQDYVCRLPSRIRKLAERSAERKSKQYQEESFSWIYGRPVQL